MSPSNVLVPLDGSPLADDALEYALETFDGRVTVLNVVTPLDASMSEGGVLGTDEARLEAARDRADRLVERARTRGDEAGRTVETVVETGDPAETILEYVEANAVEGIVMGSHGEERSAIGRRLLGTVATTVVAEAPVTVTVVR